MDKFISLVYQPNIDKGHSATSQLNSGSDNKTNSNGPENDSDSDLEIVDEVINVAIIRVLDAETKAQELVTHVTLSDDEDNQNEPVIPTSGLIPGEGPGPSSKKMKIESVVSDSSRVL